MDYNLDNNDDMNDEKPRSARRRAREFAVQGIYQYLINYSDIPFILASIEEYPEFFKSDKNHLKRLLSGTIQEKDILVGHFSQFLDREMETISPIEHAVLLIGTYELLHCLDIPYKVVINEAVELTKRFGGLEGYKYINGVLDKLAPVLRPHG
jgi:N utilization substance protein B